MDCAISSVATEAAAPAMGSQSGNSGTSLCDQGRRFSELLQAPAGQGTSDGGVRSVTDTYVPTPEAAPSGGTGLNTVANRIYSFVPDAPTHNETFESASSEPVGEVAALQEIQREALLVHMDAARISVMSNMVSSATGSVRTMFNQQG